MLNSFDSKKRSSLIIVIILIAVFFFALFNSIELLHVSSFDVFCEEILSNEQGWIGALIFLGVLLLQFFFNPITMFIILYKFIKGTTKVSDIKNKIHPKFNIEYFRDDLSHVSPAIASFLVDLELNVDRDIPAHILKLCLDGYVKEEAGKYIVTNKEKQNLLNSDAIIIDYVASNFSNQYLLSQYKRAVIDDAIKEGYIKQYSRVKWLIGFILIPIVIFILAFSLLPNIGTLLETNQPLGIAIVIIFAILTMIAGVLMTWGTGIAFWIFLRHRSYRRTKAGNVLLEQIMGLKNYLSDFSALSQSKLQEIVLREYYLVYAIVLEINKDIDDEVLLKIQNQMKNR